MKTKQDSIFLFEKLETRLLLNADPALQPLAAGISSVAEASVTQMPHQIDHDSNQAGEYQRREVVFVDAGISDYETLIRDLNPQPDTGRTFEIIAIQSGQDGIRQISAHLESRQNVDAVHIFSHGQDAGIKVGDTWLTSQTIDAYKDDLQSWGQSLAVDADLLFYGCSVAQSDAGRQLTQEVAALTGADVAASEDVTGNGPAGGDWVLEHTRGDIETRAAFSYENNNSWSGVLATFTVNTTDDTNDANTGDGVAQDSGGNTSLRAAIEQANANPDEDTIVLPSGYYRLTMGELDIKEDLVITGADPNTSVIDVNGLGRVLKTNDTSSVTISGITVMGGNKNDGGGIRVENNTTLNLSNAIVRDNTSNHGGGMRVDGTVTLNGVLFYNNEANDGGGIYFKDTEGATLTNVTISGNEATSQGGGIWTDNPTNGPINITNATIAYNTAPSGAGIYVQNTSNITIANSILYQPASGANNSNIGLTSGDYNIDADNTAVLGGANDIANVDPLIAPLADNGGSIPTHALQESSVNAIDPAGMTGAPSLDGRGFSRDLSPDIGAYEYTATTLTNENEFLVNDSNETDRQETSGDVLRSQRAVAMADDGSYVVAWSSNGQDAFGSGVSAQRFDSSGTALTGEILINQVETGDEQWARVVSDGDGNFIVTWTSDHEGTNNVYARRFDSDGNPLDDEFRVNTTTANDQQDSSIAMDAFGNFIIAWEGNGPGDTQGIFYQRFHADGTAMAIVDQMANQDAADTDEDVSVAMSSHGSYVFAWIKDNGVIKYRFFDKDGTLIPDSEVTLFTAASSPDVAMDAEGNFVVVFRLSSFIAVGSGIWGQRFDATGAAQGSSFRTGPYAIIEIKDHDKPSIAMDDLGNFVVTYKSSDDGTVGTKDVFAVKFEADATRIGSEFQVSQTGPGDQHMASLAMLDTDNFVVAFTGEDSGQTGVFARQYGGNQPPVLDLDDDNSSGATGNHFSLTFTEGEPAAAIADTDTDLTDWDSTTFNHVTLTLANLLDENDEQLLLDGSTFALATNEAGQDTTGGNYHVVVSAAAGSATVTISRQGGGTFNETEIETLIESIQYKHIDGDNPSDGDRLIDVVVNDGDTNSAPARTTINVNPVNDAPTFSAFSAIIDTTNEDTQVELTLAELLAQGNEADVDGTVTAFIVQSVSSGTLLIGANAGAATPWAVTTNDVIDAANHAYWTPASNANGTHNAFQVKAQDDSGDVSIGNAVAQVSVTSVNDEPAGADTTVTTLEDTDYVFTTANFGFSDTSDSPTDALSQVVVASLPAAGTLFVDADHDGVIDAGEAVSVNDAVTLSDITNGYFKFKAVADAHGTGYTSFTFQVRDDGGTANGGQNTDQTPSTMNINVTPDNDSPILDLNTIEISDGNTVILSEDNLSATDKETDSALLTFTVSNVTGGQFELVSNPGVPLDNFTQEQVTNGEIQFAHQQGEPPPNYTIKVSDGNLSSDSTPMVRFTPQATDTKPEPVPEPEREQTDTVITENIDVVEDIVEETEVINEEIDDTDTFAPYADNTSNKNRRDDSSSSETTETQGGGNNPNSASDVFRSTFSQAPMDQDHNALQDRYALYAAAMQKLLIKAQTLSPETIAAKFQGIVTLSEDEYEYVRKSLAEFGNEINSEIKLGRTILGSTMATSVGLSAGYVIWLLKGGSLMASVLSSLPAWHLADPLAILGGITAKTDEDEESLENIIDKASDPNKHKKDTVNGDESG